MAVRGEVRVELRRRIGAYGVCRDRAGRVLMVRASGRSTRPGTWFLPGGGLDQGEHPADAVVREVAEETGLRVEITGLRDVVAEVIPRRRALEHTDGVIYDLTVVGGTEQPEVDGTSDALRWLAPPDLDGRPISGIAARALGLPLPAGDGRPGIELLPSAAAATTGGTGPAPRPARGQRFGAYGVVTDPAGRMLLTLISGGYPGAGRWHLPGGGTDFCEQPADGLLREVMEESGQHGRITGLLTVSNSHNLAALGPEGYPIDWHSVRAIFQVTVDQPTAPRVLDRGGSTAEAGWFAPAEVAALALTDVAAAMVARVPTDGPPPG